MERTESSVRLLMMAIDRIDEVYYRAQRASGMKDSLFVLMYALSDGRPRSQKQICAEWHIPRSTLNTAVLEQVRLGNVELVGSGHKEKYVSLTDKGAECMRSSLAPLFEAEEHAERSVDVADLAEQLDCFAVRLEAGLYVPASQGENEKIDQS